MQNRTATPDATAPPSPPTGERAEFAGRDAALPIRDQLNWLGPESLQRHATRPSLDEASAYCRRLATTHYENFTVASWLLPADLRKHFCHLYAYCRWADDLADELDDPARSLRLLDWWQTQLHECQSGDARHPVFVALRETMREFDLPLEPFEALLDAFRQDQRVTRYETWDELIGYCARSANPVGRLVLRLGRRATAENDAWSDAICTGLQLANFCQDVARDFARGRIYLPRCEWSGRGCDEHDFAVPSASAALREAIAASVERAEQSLLAGRPLISNLHGRLRIAVDLFLRGGLDILRAVRRLRYDVLAQRPVVGRARKLTLVAQAVLAAAIASRTERKLDRRS